MSQKVQVYKNTNDKSKSFGKYFVRPVYDNKFVTTKELADFIQAQASVKRSDCKAVLDELGEAFRHFFALGQKIKLDNIGIFKVGCSSQGVDSEVQATASIVTARRVLFQPETKSIATGENAEVTRGSMVYLQPIYNHVPNMLMDVTFELAQNTTGSGITGNSGGSGGSGNNGGGGDDDQPIVNP